MLLDVKNDSLQEENVSFAVKVKDYNGCPIETYERAEYFPAEDSRCVELPVKCDKLGYFSVDIAIQSSDKTIHKKTGVGLTTPHKRSEGTKSAFGVSCNFCDPPRHFPLFAKLGVRWLRTWGVPENEALMRKYGLLGTIQMQGRDIFTKDGKTRYARPESNSVYHYQKQWGDLAVLQEHGNEHWEEKNLNLLSEWHKVSGLARLKADPSGWYANSGCPGMDINKLKVMYDQGVFDYLTCICIHAYSFPGCPEGKDSYWSVERMVDLGRWMREMKIDMPVCCTEQGYPAMYDQTKCESYSPGEMVTLDGQVDYLVRSWLIFLSYGVSKIVWFNGPWYDGFGILEKDGPAPWPAAMALAQLIRAVDRAEYVGDYRKDEGVYFKVFRQTDSGRLIAAVWRPVYYSRSCEAEKNLSLDGRFTEADGKAQETFDYPLHHVKDDFAVKDIMGNDFTASDGKIVIGERPVYIYGLSEDILPLLDDLTCFPRKEVVAKPLPADVILGFSDNWPDKAEPYLTSRFQPGQTRSYQLRVHNYSDSVLDDTAVLDIPSPFCADAVEIPVQVLPGHTATYPVKITCDDVAACGEYKLHARLKWNAAHPVYQIAAVYCPVYCKPIVGVFGAGQTISLCVANYAPVPKTYRVSVKSLKGDFELAQNFYDVSLKSGETKDLVLAVTRADALVEPAVSVVIEDGVKRAEYPVVIPIHSIDCVKNADSDTLLRMQKKIISGYNLIMTAGQEYKGPELFGQAKPEPLNAYASMAHDAEHLVFPCEIHDPTVVCAKNTRRNNLDSDGVWIRLYDSAEAEKPYRHFCVTPVDQAGQTSGCAVNEVSSGILFATPYTDYDFSQISVQSKVFETYYVLEVAVRRNSIGLAQMPEEIVADIRVINMNHTDWPKFYDTGKIAYKIIK